MSLGSGGAAQGTDGPRSAFSRRDVARRAAALIVAVVAGGHTPYGQWTIYRQRNLFIVASRTDAQAVELAHSVAAGLARELPESHASMTRASDPVRIASLLATGQLDVAVVLREEAMGMLAGAGVYRAVGPVPLRLLAELGAHLLVTVEGFKVHHAYLLAAALDHLRDGFPITAAVGSLDAIPEHPGAAAYRRGEALPDVGEGAR